MLVSDSWTNIFLKKTEGGKQTPGFLTQLLMLSSDKSIRTLKMKATTSCETPLFTSLHGFISQDTWIIIL